MADKTYKITFELSDGTEKSVEFVSPQGEPGKDGIAPHIGDNGNWYIGETDTGIPATGPEGKPGADGIEGKPGKDGVSPTVSVSEIEGGHSITITDASGTKTINVLNGSDGVNGNDGNDGKDGNGIKSVVLNEDYTLTLTFDDGTSYTTPSIRGAVGATGSPGKDGSNGKDGVSATHSWNGTTLTITSASGTSSADLKGEPGKDGVDGKDGYTPVKGKDYFDGNPGEDGTSVTVKSVSESAEDGGSNVVEFSDGKTVTIKNGKTGGKGDPGSDGKTPVKGTDYWTSADRSAMVSDVLAALPTWNGGSY